MALMPEDLMNQRFTPVRFSEGYDMDEVDNFLDNEVEPRLKDLISENERLKKELEEAHNRIAELESGAPDIRFIGACDQPPDFDALHRAASRCGSEISPGNYRAPAMSFDRDQNCARGGSSLNLSYQLVDPSSAPLHARSGRLFRTSTATNDDALDVSDDQTTLADRVEPPATRPTRQ